MTRTITLSFLILSGNAHAGTATCKDLHQQAIQAQLKCRDAQSCAYFKQVAGQYKQCELDAADNMLKAQHEAEEAQQRKIAEQARQAQEAAQAARAESDGLAATATPGMKQELLSAILCIDLDAQAQAKEAIAEEKRNAKESGGGIIDMEAIHGAQDDFARAGREATHVRKQLAALKLKPKKCEEVARAYNCINSRADELQSSNDGVNCSIQNFTRWHALVEELRLDRQVESSRLYTFTGPVPEQ